MLTINDLCLFLYFAIPYAILLNSLFDQFFHSRQVQSVSTY